jgi:hypothetical protein
MLYRYFVRDLRILIRETFSISKWTNFRAHNRERERSCYGLHIPDHASSMSACRGLASSHRLMPPTRTAMSITHRCTRKAKGVEGDFWVVRELLWPNGLQPTQTPRACGCTGVAGLPGGDCQRAKTPMLTPLWPLLRSRAKNQESLGVRVVQRAIRGNFHTWDTRRGCTRSSGIGGRSAARPM